MFGHNTEVVLLRAGSYTNLGSIKKRKGWDANCKLAV